MRFIDLHCDTLMQAFVKGVDDLYLLDSMADPGRLEAGGAMAQCFAVFLPPSGGEVAEGVPMPDDEVYIERLHTILMNTVRCHSDRFALARSAAEVKANAAGGRLSAILTIEDGRVVRGRMENLDRIYAMGARMMSLTWNHANCFGFPNSRDPAVMSAGLTAFGREAIEHMNELGMAIDVSHLSDGGFRDVARISKKPFLATHSNCRAISPSPRNLTDGMIRTLAEQGGVAGLNFYGAFLNEDAACEVSTAAMIARHARHMANVGGVGVVALGSDFDGIGGQLEVSGSDKMHLVFDALADVGFTEDEIECIARRNALRFMEDAAK